MAGYETTYGSRVVNGQLVPVYEAAAMSPGNALQVLFKGNGARPATIPAGVGATGMSARGAVASAAASNPLDPRQSPIIVMLLMLVLGLAGLRYIHWRSH